MQLCYKKKAHLSLLNVYINYYYSNSIIIIIQEKCCKQELFFITERQLSNTNICAYPLCFSHFTKNSLC